MVPAFRGIVVYWQWFLLRDHLPGTRQHIFGQAGEKQVRIIGNKAGGEILLQDCWKSGRPEKQDYWKWAGKKQIRATG
jgi:hypothetical protein